MSRQFHHSALGAALLCALAAPAAAQTINGSGSNWNGGYTFGTANDRAVALQQAQAIRAAKSSNGPSTVITHTTIYDNRSNYIEYSPSGEVEFTGDLQIGDQIGQNTNSIGAMNTGTTNIAIDGSGNIVTATNAADNTGCVDGSIGLHTVDSVHAVSSLGVDISLGAMPAKPSCY